MQSVLPRKACLKCGTARASLLDSNGPSSIIKGPYAVLSRNLFCRDLRVFAWRKNEPKIVPVEKKWQIWGMDTICEYSALALSVRGPFGPMRCARRLDNQSVVSFLPQLFAFAIIHSALSLSTLDCRIVLSLLQRFKLNNIIIYCFPCTERDFFRKSNLAPKNGEIYPNLANNYRTEKCWKTR